MKPLRDFYYRFAPFPRMRPGFLIIGAQKCGTTSLADWLSQHPSVSPPRTKELKYFTREEEYAKGRQRYFSNFPPRFLNRSANAMSFEATPCLFHPQAPARVRETLGQIKKIILLREPVERAVSHYKHNRRNGREQREIEVAMAEELEALEQGCPADLKDPASFHRYGDVSYISKGIYIRQIDAWLKHHDPDSFLIIRSEDMFEDPRKSLGECLEFLGLPHAESAAIQMDAKNTNKLGQVVPEALRARLASLYEEPNRELAARFGIEW